MKIIINTKKIRPPKLDPKSTGSLCKLLGYPEGATIPSSKIMEATYSLDPVIKRKARAEWGRRGWPH